MDEQVFSFRDVLRAVLRRRRIVGVIALIGLILGLGYALASPALVSAKTQVLLPFSAVTASGSTNLDPQTEVQIALSPDVLTPAANEAGVHLAYTSLQKRVAVTAVTNNILQIVAKASSATQAEVFANDIATHYVNYTTNQDDANSNSQIQVLKSDESSIQGEYNATVTQVAKIQANLATLTPGSTDYKNEDTLLGNETTAEAGFAQDLKLVELQATQADLSQGNTSADAQILERATYATSPPASRIPKAAGIGLLIGLLIGIIAAFAVGRKDKRIRTRDEIARAAGAPVLASVSAKPLRRSDDLLSVLEHFEPSVSDKANMRRLLDALDVPRKGHPDGAPTKNGSSWHTEGPVDVKALVLAGDQRGVVAVAEVAAFAAGLGLPVSFVVDGSNVSTEQLAIACAARDPHDRQADRPNLKTYASAPEEAPQGVVLSITLEIVDPETLDVGDAEAIDLRSEHQTGMLLVVSTGHATPEDIEVVALFAEHRDRPLTGVVVADPDESDKTSGQPPARFSGSTGQRHLSALRTSAR